MFRPLVGKVRPSQPFKLQRRVGLEFHPLVHAALDTKSGTPNLPQDFDMAQWQLQLLDQGRTGSCTCESTPHAAATATAAMVGLGLLEANPLPFVGSPRNMYAAVRGRERALSTPPGTPPAALTDSGANLSDVFEILAEYGTIPMVAPTPDGRNTDVWSSDDVSGLPNPPPANVNDEPDFLALEQGASHIIVGPYGVDPTAANISDVLAAALAVGGMPIELATFVDTAFMDLQAGQIAPVPNTSDPEGGGHAIYLSGYQWNAQLGQRVFILTNSWGVSWANAGRCLVGLPWIQSCWELHPMQVKVMPRAAALRRAA